MKLLEGAIERGAVSRQIVELLSDVHDKFGDRRPCSFFPVWSTGNFLLSLINTSGDADLSQTAQLLLDHNMRLHATFRAQRLHPDVIEAHIERLEQAQRKIGLDSHAPDRPLRDAFRAISPESATEIRIAYGDVSNPAIIGDQVLDRERLAIVSPEDTTISAGGGVALRLLTKAGPRQLLNELSKLSPIEQGTCAVTSAGNLPVHYVLHAAALRILPDGAYDINTEQIEGAIRDGLLASEALKVSGLWIPLLGAGVADIPPADSLSAILRAVAGSETSQRKRIITVAIYHESILGRDSVRSALRDTLPRHYTVAEV